MLETHWKVMAMTFRSQGDAYIFYNNHAREHEFSIRKQKVKRGCFRNDTVPAVSLLQGREKAEQVHNHGGPQAQA